MYGTTRIAADGRQQICWALGISTPRAYSLPVTNEAVDPRWACGASAMQMELCVQSKLQSSTKHQASPSALQSHPLGADKAARFKDEKHVS